MRFDSVVRLISLSLIATIVGACTSDGVEESADSVFLNAAVYTVDADRSWAQAVAVDDGKIVYVGTDAGASDFIGEATTVRDLQGAMLLPGFHDGHTHLLIGGFDEQDCNLLRLETMEEVEAELERCSQFRGRGADRWVYGAGWGEWLWPDGNPNKSQLDEWFPDRPVYFDSSYGHSGWVNSRALEIAGISAETPNPHLGIIERDNQTGEATGTLRESAMSLVRQHVPEPSMEQKLREIRAAIDLAHSFGITAVIEPGMDESQIGPVVQMSDNGDFNMRALISLSPLGWISSAFDDEVFEFLEQRERWRRPNIDVDSVKIYMDGVVESGTAAVLDAYEVEEFGHGLSYYDQDKLNEYMTRFDAMGLQIHIHAIGDAGVRMALNGYEAAREANGVSDNRHQMVHLQMVDDAEISTLWRTGCCRDLSIAVGLLGTVHYRVCRSLYWPGTGRPDVPDWQRARGRWQDCRWQ